MQIVTQIANSNINITMAGNLFSGISNSIIDFGAIV